MNRSASSKLAILALSALILGGCGRFSSSDRPPGAGLQGTTGYFDAEGIDYTDGGDERVAEALKDAPPAAPGESVLARSLREFELTRFAKDSDQPTQKGNERFSLKVFFTDRETVEFAGPFGPAGGEWTVDSEVKGLKLTGKIKDEESQTKGDFLLTDLKGEMKPARIFYRAYKGRVDVRADKSKTPSPETAKTIAAFKSGAFAWVHNWVVVNGPSFYLVDIVTPSTGEPLLEFKGKSKRTGEKVHETTPLKAAPRTEVKLVGNSEEESRRLFAVEVKESPNAKPDEFLLDVIWDEPAAKPDPKKDLPPPAAKDGAYLKTDLDTPRSRRMVTDFDKNFGLSGVKKFIREFQGNARRDLQNFYTYANPFRGLIEKIGLGYDVSPAFAYLTVVESVYFTGGRYEIEGSPKSTALGPFQLLRGTGEEVGLRVSGDRSDERRFFGPSACGGAKYVQKKVDQFRGGDSTLAILAYYQGFAKAASYARADKLAKNFSYTYAEMDRLAIIPAHMRAYVNKKLAVYFISANLPEYGFTAPTRIGALPDNGTVFPPAPIADVQCRNLLKDYISTGAGS